MELQQLLELSVQKGASDLHISSGTPPALRIDGDIQKVSTEKLAQRQVFDMVHGIMNEQQQADFKKKLEADFSINLEGLARFRVNVFMQRHGPSAVFRTIPSREIGRAHV